MNAPEVICPFSRTGDVTVGNTPSEVAVNLARGTRIALAFGFSRAPLRPCPDVWSLFPTRQLSEEAREARRYLAQIYSPFRIKPPAPVINQEELAFAE